MIDYILEVLITRDFFEAGDITEQQFRSKVEELRLHHGVRN